MQVKIVFALINWQHQRQTRTMRNQTNFFSERKKLLRFFDADNFLNRCGACALYDLNKFKIGSVKIVGREDLTAKKIRDIKFIRKSVDLLRDNLGEQAFTEKVMALYTAMHSSNCKAKFCYYPT